MTPLHLALTYAPIVNEGNIPSPHLLKEAKVAEVEKCGFKKNQEILKSALIKVINDPDGAGELQG